jgi:formylglycine-generating enzyme required for sulfatase activity
VSLNKSETELLIGESETLYATIIPKNANKSVNWESSNPNVASVNNGKVTAVTIGKTTITVTTKNGNHSVSCIVTVIQAIEPEMVKVESGTFLMGCTDDDCSIDGREEPTHYVTLNSFNIAKYPVTQKEWIALMGENPSYNKTNDSLPVEMVTWSDIQQYIKKLNMITGKGYRLPTEAEWEYAARGGKSNNNYSFSGSNDVNEVAWINGHTYPVGLKKPNELGIYDMSGNVFEYCSDWYGLYSEEHLTNPQGSTEGFGKVIRGGNFGNTALYARVSYRMFNSYLNYGSSNTGFRLVLP